MILASDKWKTSRLFYFLKLNVSLLTQNLTTESEVNAWMCKSYFHVLPFAKEYKLGTDLPWTVSKKR